MSKETDKKEFEKLNEDYQKCLNGFYDKFLDGEDVDFNNICLDQLEKLKSKEQFYNLYSNEYKKFLKNESEKSGKN
jgi:hypothetical protein